jgi:hypothetical protein
METVKKLLKDVVGAKSADQIMCEIEPTLQDLQQLGWNEMRPWSDFFATFKTPQFQFKHLEQRIVTNFLHYRTNYAFLSLGVLALQILMAPMILFTAFTIVGLWTYLFVIHRTSLILGDIVLDATKKKLLFGGITCLLFVVTGTLERLLWTIIYSVLLCGLHMVFRPRSVSSKANRVYEEAKLNGINIGTVFGFAEGKSSGNFSGASKHDDIEDPTTVDEGYPGNFRRRGGKAD